VNLRRARLIPYRLPLVRGLHTAQGVIAERRGWLLELETESGAVGRGDACPFPGDPDPAGEARGFGMESWSVCGERLESLAAGLLGQSVRWDAGLAEVCPGLAPDAPAARFAVDCAWAELVARERGQSVAALLAEAHGGAAQDSLALSALVSGASAQAVAAEGKALEAAGFGTFKLKLGGGPLAEDVARVEALRGTLGPGAKIRVDANGALSRREASRLLADLSGLGVECIEQPVAPGDVEGLAELRAQGKVAIAADEVLADAGRAQEVLTTRAADLLVLKPAALGGLRPAMALAAAARDAGMEFYVTSLLDSAFGVAAAIHLAAALPARAPAHGLATAALFEFDLARTPPPESGRISVPTGPGWGIEIDPDGLTRAAAGRVIEVGA